MPRGHKIMLSFSDWPAEDQHRWEAAFKSSDRFDERSYGAHLAPTTRKARRDSYGRFLGFISAVHPERLMAQAQPGSIAALWRNTSLGADNPRRWCRLLSILVTFVTR